MGEVIKFRTNADIPPRAHRYVIRAIRFLDRHEDLVASAKNDLDRLGISDDMPAAWIPSETKEKVERAGRYHYLATICMDKAEALAIDAGVPRKFWHSKGVVLNGAPRRRA